MAKDRAKDVNRSVGSHQEMMSALGRATGYISVASNKRYGNVIGKVGKSSVEHTGQPHVKAPKAR